MRTAVEETKAGLLQKFTDSEQLLRDRSRAQSAACFGPSVRRQCFRRSFQQGPIQTPRNA